MSAPGETAAPFAARTVLILVALGVVGFLSYLLLSAYAGDCRPPQSGGTHALSNSAVGYSGAAELYRRTHGEVRTARTPRDLADPDTLLVLTPGPTTGPSQLKAVVDRRDGMTLIVLPKWIVAPSPKRQGWVRAIGTLPPSAVATIVSQVAPVTIGPESDGLRTISGAGLTPILTAPDGRAWVSQVDDTGILIAADSDLLDNHGLTTVAGAERAMDLLDSSVPDGGTVAFDLTLHGFGRNPNLLKLALEPPFLPLTLCLLAAALMAGWHAMLRFGPAFPEERGTAFGKRALAENGAALLRLAGRRHRTGARYVALVRDSASAATGAPAGLRGEALDRYLDGLSGGGEPFSVLAQAAIAAPDTRRLLTAARKLYQWKRTVTRDHQ